MAIENPAFRHLPEEVIDLIPTSCTNCPALLGRLSIYNEFQDTAIRERKRTWNPLSKAAITLSMHLSKNRLLRDIEERGAIMDSCHGTIEYPANFSDSTTLCGVGVREDMMRQITNEV
jgi:hypothetical protein